MGGALPHLMSRFMLHHGAVQVVAAVCVTKLLCQSGKVLQAVLPEQQPMLHFGSVTIGHMDCELSLLNSVSATLSCEATSTNNPLITCYPCLSCCRVCQGKVRMLLQALNHLMKPERSLWYKSSCTVEHIVSHTLSDLKRRPFTFDAWTTSDL